MMVSALKIPDGKKLRKLVNFLEMLFYLLESCRASDDVNDKCSPERPTACQ